MAQLHPEKTSIQSDKAPTHIGKCRVGSGTNSMQGRKSQTKKNAPLFGQGVFHIVSIDK
jgi:hypothetical protein